MLKLRILFAILGLIYGLALAFWGIVISGGGHFNLPAMLFLSPFWFRSAIPFGLVLWPLWGFLAVRFNSLLSKVLFVFTMVGHFVGLALYILDPDNSDAYWFNIAVSVRWFIPSVVLALLLYFVAQIFLWVRFLKDTLGHRQFA